jgi:hypothetical protein
VVAQAGWHENTAAIPQAWPGTKIIATRLNSGCGSCCCKPASKNNKKARRKAGQGYQIPGESGSLQNTVLFLAANFTLFKDSHDGHQADTADGGGVQRRKGAGPAGQAEDRVPSAIIPRPSLAKLSPIR